MQKVTLSQALKIKSRLAGELVRLQNIIKRENSCRANSTSTVDVGKVFDALNKVQEKLVHVKTKIAEGNQAIYGFLAQMEELKTHILFLASLDTKDGLCVDEKTSWRSESLAKEVEYRAFMKQSDVDEKTIELQQKIESFQDEIDKHNVSTHVELNF